MPNIDNYDFKNGKKMKQPPFDDQLACELKSGFQTNIGKTAIAATKPEPMVANLSAKDRVPSACARAVVLPTALPALLLLLMLLLLLLLLFKSLMKPAGTNAVVESEIVAGIKSEAVAVDVV